MNSANESEAFAVLALRYLDGSAGADEVRRLEDCLRDSEGRRREYLELAHTAALLSDYHRIEASATVIGKGRLPHNQLSRAFAAAAAVAAALFSALFVWDATEPPPMAIAGLGPVSPHLDSKGLPWNPDPVGTAVPLVDEEYGFDSIEAASLDAVADADAGFPEALRSAGGLDFDFVPFDFSTVEEADPLAWVHPPSPLF